MKSIKQNSRTKHAALIASGSILFGSAALYTPLPAYSAVDSALVDTAVATSPVSPNGSLASLLNCNDSGQDATCSLIIRFGGANQIGPVIELATIAANITTTATGYQLTSDVIIKTPQGDIPLRNANLQLTIGSSPSAGITGIQGTADLPFPKLGFLKDANISQNATAFIGMDSGKNLANLGAHLNPDRNYMVFHFDQGMSGTVGPMKITAPGGQSATFVLDPSDPYFYIGGSGFGGESSFGVEFCDKTPEECAQTGETYGFGLSLTGQIPFENDNPTLSFANELANMKGHLVMDGTIPLGDLPLSITGSAVVNIDADNDGVTFFDSPLDTGGIPTNALGIDTKLAAKGSLDVGIPFLKVFETGIQLAEGTVLITNSKFEKSVYFNGVQAIGTGALPIIPSYLPLTQKSVLDVSGHFLIDTSNFGTPEGRQRALESMKEGYLIANGNFDFDARNLGALANVDLGSLAVASAQLTLDQHGFALSGQTSTNLPIPNVGFTSKANINLDIPADNINASKFNMKGNLNVAGISLGNGMLDVSSKGATISGEINAVIGKINMSGTANRSAVSLTGSTAINIPLSKFAEALGPQITKANNDLQKALNDVSTLNTVVTEQRRIVKSEHDQVSAKLQSAQQDVQTAQTKVNLLQNQINSFYGTIAQYRSDINWWNNWYKNLPWYKKSYSWAKLAYETGWRGTAIGGLYISIAGIEASKATANQVLSAYKQTLAGINTSILAIPVDLDPRVSGPLGALEIAKGTLRTAQAVVSALPKLGDFSGVTVLTIDNNGLKGNIAGSYTFAVNNTQATVGVTGKISVNANNFKACLDLPGASGVCVAL